MKTVLLNRKKWIFVALGIAPVTFAIYLAGGILLLKLGSLSYKNGNYSKAESYYRYASKFLLIGTRAGERLYALQNEINSPQDLRVGAVDTITVSTTDIKILNSSVSKGIIENFSNETDPPDYYRRYLLSAMLKNKSDYGIPVVKATKLNMYDATGKLVMTKDNPIQDILLVKDGEIPFTYYFNLRESHGVSINSFSLEFEIPSFTPNNNVVRLEINNLRQVTKNPVSEGSKSYKYKYRLTLKNPSDSMVKDVYRISFLKFNGMPLTRSGHECCLGLETVKEEKTEGVLRIEDINKPDSPLIFQPREQKDVTFEMIVDDVFSEFGSQYTYNPDRVEPVIVVIGTKYIP